MKLALEEALRCLAEADPAALAWKSGAEYVQGSFSLSFFNRRLQVDFPGGKVLEEGHPSPSIWLQVTVLHYLLTANGVAPADRWIAFRELPGGNALLGNFEMNTMAPLTAVLGDDPGAFRKAALALGGYPMGLGDVSFRFMAFPRLPMACILWEGEEGMPPAINMVFDAAAHHYLHTEDLAAVAEYLSQTLRRGPWLEGRTPTCQSLDRRSGGARRRYGA